MYCRHERAIAGSYAPLDRNRPICIGCNPRDARVQRKGRLGELHPADILREALDYCGRVVIRRSRHLETGSLHYIDQSLATDNQNRGTRGNKPSQQLHRSLWGRHDVVRDNAQPHACQVFGDRRRRPRCIVRDVANANRLRDSVYALNGIWDRILARVDDAVQIREHQIDTVEGCRITHPWARLRSRPHRLRPQRFQ